MGLEVKARRHAHPLPKLHRRHFCQALLLLHRRPKAATSNCPLMMHFGVRSWLGAVRGGLGNGMLHHWWSCGVVATAAATTAVNCYGPQDWAQYCYRKKQHK